MLNREHADLRERIEILEAAFARLCSVAEGLPGWAAAWDAAFPQKFAREPAGAEGVATNPGG